MMPSQHLPKHPPAPANTGTTVAPAFESFRQREVALSALQQILRLVADIQQHRGSSMAILAGNRDFEPRLAMLQAKVKQRLTYLDLSRDNNIFISDGFNSDGFSSDGFLSNGFVSKGFLSNGFFNKGFLSNESWQAILQEWQAVSEGWRDDTVLPNFELHSHLVDKLLQLMRAGGKWLFESDMVFKTAIVKCLDISVLPFAFQTLPQHIELLAKLRGLSTHAVAMGSCDNDHRVRIDYLLQLAKREQVNLRNFTAQRPVKVLRLIPGLLDTQLNEVVFTQWVTRISTEVLQKGKIQSSLADELFAQGTEIINGFFAINQQSLAYVRQALEDMLEEVLQQTR